MGETTNISWTNATFNPWWGCARVSPGCNNCYAETFAKRTGHVIWGKSGERRFFGDKHWAEPLKWNRKAGEAGARHKVFCASMADVFEDREDLVAERARLFDLIIATPNLDWQLLTKRPENVARLAPAHWMGDWPANCWMGTTVEDQARANERVPVLAKIPAPVRFLSCEPLLGPVSLAPWLHYGLIDWVIVGGESGPKHRKLDVENARVLRDECEEAGVAYFFKQVGGLHPTSGGDLLDGRQHKEFPGAR